MFAGKGPRALVGGENWVVDSFGVGHKERIDDLDSRLSKVEVSLHLAPQKSPLARAWEWIINNKGTSIILSIVLCVGGALYKHHLDHEDEDFGYRVDARVDKKLGDTSKKLGEMNDKLTTIDAKLTTLQPLIEDLIKHEMDKAASLPQSEFKKNLPAMEHLVSAARNQGVRVNPEVVRRLGEKLLNIQSRGPDFWPTSAQLVSYRSSNNAPSNVLQLASAILPNCTDSEPQPMRIAEVLSAHEARISLALYEDCRITLDSPTDDERINSFIVGKFPRIKFKNCLVIYRGGQITLKLEWKGEVIGLQMKGRPPMTIKMSGNTLEFEKCLFEFTFQGVPPPVGQQVTEVLLAQNSDTLKLPHP